MSRVYLDDGHQDLFDELLLRSGTALRSIESGDPSLHLEQLRADIRVVRRIAAHLSTTFDLQRKISA